MGVSSTNWSERSTNPFKFCKELSLRKKNLPSMVASNFAVAGLLLVLGVAALLLGVLLADVQQQSVPVTPLPTLTPPWPSVTLTPSVSPILPLFLDWFVEPGTGTTPLTSHIPDVGNGGAAWSALTLAGPPPLTLPSLTVFNGLNYCSCDVTDAVLPANTATFAGYTGAQPLQATVKFVVPATLTAAGQQVVGGVFLGTATNNGVAFQLGVNFSGSPYYDISVSNYTGLAVGTLVGTATMTADLTRDTELTLVCVIPSTVDVNHPVTMALTAASGNLHVSGTAIDHNPSADPYATVIMQWGRTNAAGEKQGVRLTQLLLDNL